MLQMALYINLELCHFSVNKLDEMDKDLEDNDANSFELS